MVSTMASRKKSGTKFDPFGPQRELTRGAVNAAKSVVSNAQAVAGLIGSISRSGTQSMMRGMNPGRSNLAGSMISSATKQRPPYQPGVVGKKPSPTLKQISQEKNRKVPLGPNKPAPKKSVPKKKAAPGGSGKKSKPAF